MNLNRVRYIAERSHEGLVAIKIDTKSIFQNVYVLMQRGDGKDRESVRGGGGAQTTLAGLVLCVL
jgi:hypothetical protein